MARTVKDSSDRQVLAVFHAVRGYGKALETRGRERPHHLALSLIFVGLVVLLLIGGLCEAFAGA